MKTEMTALEFGADHDWSGLDDARRRSSRRSRRSPRRSDTDFTGRILDVAGFGTTWPSATI